MSKISYYTEKGLKKLRKKLDQLKDVERPRASQAIAEARDKGDLSENAEYDAAKEAQGLLELEISKLEETLSNARIIDETKLDTSKVLVLSTVIIWGLFWSLTAVDDFGRFTLIVSIFVRYKLEIIKKDKIAKIISIIGRMLIKSPVSFFSLKYMKLIKIF